MVNGVICSRIMRRDRKSFIYGHRETNVQVCQLNFRLRSQMAILLQLLLRPIRLCTYFYQDVMRLLTEYITRTHKEWRITDTIFGTEMYTLHKSSHSHHKSHPHMHIYRLNIKYYVCYSQLHVMWQVTDEPRLLGNSRNPGDRPLLSRIQSLLFPHCQSR